jgi:hypothetical protein
LAVVPVIKEFRSRLDALRAAELERALKHLAHLSSEDRAQIERFSHSLLNKFLHEPTRALKEAAEHGRGYALLEAVRRLFGFGGGGGGPAAAAARAGARGARASSGRTSSRPTWASATR